ncbi:transcription initiation factor IIF subunit beta-like [Dorcoceras hygrometricum]|uniref:Transcription initiation factor IIF subunit beta-like n=1 Tax=Dorcoceras hygrometricum TaxID=472368 RepID=A0A2Z7D7E0_9LAMI|nr:transcription initiation factor IIF subunit beta-like [Dorcoceras hygrometricum]
MSLLDLQDVCIAIGSLAPLDLPMVVDPIGICVERTVLYANHDQLVLALSVIPRGSWGDVARRFTMIRWPPQSSHGRPSTSPQPHGHAPPPRDRTCSDRRAEVIPSVGNQSSLLVQIDGGRLIPVVDLIGGSTAAYREEPDFPCEFSGWSQAPRRQQEAEDVLMMIAEHKAPDCTEEIRSETIFEQPAHDLEQRASDQEKEKEAPKEEH